MVLFLNFLIIYFTLSLGNTVNKLIFIFLSERENLLNINSSAELLDNNVKVTVVKIGNSLLRPYYIAKRTRGIAENMTMFWERAKMAGNNLTSNIHDYSPQKVSHFVHFNIEKVFPRGQP